VGRVILKLMLGNIFVEFPRLFEFRITKLYFNYCVGMDIFVDFARFRLQQNKKFHFININYNTLK
jgi:hypothetical protein